MQKYMLIMTGKAKDWKGLSPAENEAIMNKYFAFVDTLKTKHGFVAGSPLNQAGYSISAERGAVIVDGPFPETKEVFNGYMIYEAANFDQAIAIARECPALTHGDKIQLFEMSHI